ncbi:putative quinol monooxygenase [Methanolapillus millepedarum]|uniref:Monooxygenase YcnE n=1 Tax=Methanolapillus millepedarum TaxID=3028296 RepID=A0AA96ZVK5_9EURY|nr:Putative monooxygenase YcnE [Methanosarcinaceae archaeon Ac7]
MLIVLAQIKIKPETKEEFLKITKPLIAKSRAEPGCISYSLYESTEKENAYMMVEQWRSEEIFDKHVASDHFKSFGIAGGPLFAEELDIKIYKTDCECQ